MKKVVLIFCLCATAAFAHQGVQNAAVKARMHSMSTIAADMKVLGKMAKESTSFDAQSARAAVMSIAAEAAKIEELFKPQEDDPKSEAKAIIWSEFEDFTKIANDLENAANAAKTLTKLEEVQTSLAKLGATCKACHERYRD